MSIEESNTLQEYLQQRIQDSLDDGVTHVALEFSKRFTESGYATITIEELVDWQQDVNRLSQEAESFSMDHLYYWSLDTHLTDIILHAKLLEE